VSPRVAPLVLRRAGASAMRRFWDGRARENAFYFVDNTTRYADPDEKRFWQLGEELLEGMLIQLGVTVEPTDHVLDLGCGIGRMTRPIAARAGSVTALDISAEMLRLAAERSPDLRNVAWLLGDGTSLAGIGDASVDSCVSYVVFHHIPDPAVTLGYVREIGRVLKEGGWAAFQVSNEPARHDPRTYGGRRWWLRRRLRARLRKAPKGQAHPAWLGSAVRLGDLEATAGASGLRIERVEGAGTINCLVLARRAASGSPPPPAEGAA